MEKAIAIPPERREQEEGVRQQTTAVQSRPAALLSPLPLSVQLSAAAVPATGASSCVLPPPTHPPPPTVHKRQRTDFQEGPLPVSVSVVPPIMQSTTTAGRPLASAQLLSPTPPSVPPTVPTPPPLCQETGATANVARSALSRQLTHAKLLPDGWSQHYSRTSQRHFFVNNATGQKVWASGALKHKNTLYEGAVPQGTSSGRAIAPMLLRHIQEQASHAGAEDIPNQFCPVSLTDTQQHSISSMPSPQMQKDAQW